MIYFTLKLMYQYVICQNVIIATYFITWVTLLAGFWCRILGVVVMYWELKNKLCGLLDSRWFHLFYFVS